jgi:hypothetical protein
MPYSFFQEKEQIIMKITISNLEFLILQAKAPRSIKFLFLLRYVTPSHPLLCRGCMRSYAIGFSLRGRSLWSDM